MNRLITILGGTIALVGTYVIRDSLHVIITKEVAFEEAKRLSNGKGIVNIGAGPHRTFQAQIIAKERVA